MRAILGRSSKNKPSTTQRENTMENRKRLLWAGFMAILAAGVGFAIRGGIFSNWAADFGFSATELGAIGGAGFTGFCFRIHLGRLVAHRNCLRQHLVLAAWFACSSP